MKIITGIYLIESPSDKVYIGQSRNIGLRKNFYFRLKCEGQRKLFSSLKKYGWENHKFVILHILPAAIDQLLLDEFEQFYMDLFRNFEIELLNLKEAGYKGKCSNETRERLRIANLGKTHSIAAREKLRLANLGRRGKGMTGKTHSEESRRKMSDKNKNRPSWNKGKSTPKEIRLKQSEAAKNRVYSEEGWKRLIEKRRKRIPWNKGLRYKNKKT